MPYLRTLIESSSALWNAKPADAISAWLETLCTNLNWTLGELWSWEGTRLHLFSHWHDGSPHLDDFVSRGSRLANRPDRGLPGRVFHERKPVFVEDLNRSAIFKRADMASQIGLSCGLAVPIRSEEIPPMAVLLMGRKQRSDVELVTISTQVACNELGLYLRTLTKNEAEKELGEDGPYVDPGLPRQGCKILDVDRQKLEGPTGALALSGIEWQIISFLSQHQGTIVNKDDLLTRFWGGIDAHSQESLYEIISRLRRHLRTVGLDPSMVRAIPKRGYLLERDQSSDEY